MKAVIVFITALFFLYFANTVSATPPVITAYPTGTLSLDTPFTVTATMSGLTNSTTYRLRIAVAQSGTSNYFGSTYDGGAWQMGSITDGNFVNIVTDGNGSWGGDIRGKIDSNDPNFTTGSGTYDLKIGRYTQTDTTATWSDPVSIAVIVPPKPTPTSTPTPTPTPTPTNTPTPTPTPTNSPIRGSTIIPTSIPASEQSADPASEQPVSSSVLGDNMVNQPTVSPLGDLLSNGKDIIPPDPAKKPDTIFQMISMALGIVFIVICAILTFRIIKKQELTQNEEEKF